MQTNTTDLLDIGLVLHSGNKNGSVLVENDNPINQNELLVFQPFSKLTIFGTK